MIFTYTNMIFTHTILSKRKDVYLWQIIILTLENLFDKYLSLLKVNDILIVNNTELENVISLNSGIASY